jgi:hypothetical protein
VIKETLALEEYQALVEMDHQGLKDHKDRVARPDHQDLVAKERRIRN